MMYHEGFENRLVDVTEQFERHFGVRHLTDSFWTPRIAMDPQTGCYYYYEIQWCAADSAGWSSLATDLEKAYAALERLSK